MLTHFTRASRNGNALDNLVTILKERVVRAATRMVRGKQPVVCLFDAPFGELRQLLDRRNRWRYEPFGIAVNKRYAFKLGARPVIYLPWPEARKVIIPEELWRVVTIDMDRRPPSIGVSSANGGSAVTCRSSRARSSRWSIAGAMSTKFSSASMGIRRAPA